MTRSASRYLPPADRARRAARDPFAVRLAVLFAAGVIITPIAALAARSNGHEVVRAGKLPGAAVAVEPVNDSSSTVAPETKSGAFTVAENAPSEVTSPLVLTPLGSGTFWSWASAGRLAWQTTSRLASAAIIVLVIIGVLSRRSCELSAIRATPQAPRRSVHARQHAGRGGR